MNKTITRIVWKVVKKNPAKMICMVIAIVGSIIASLYPPLILERMVNMLTNNKQIVLTIAFMYLLIFALSGILESLQNIMITMVGQAITHEIRSTMSKKLKDLSTGYFTGHETGKITSRFVNDVDAVDSLFTNGIINMFADVFKVISILIVIFIKSKGLGMMMCVVTPILCVMTYVFQKKMRNAQIRNREAVAKVNHHVPETIRNIRMIHNTQCESYMEGKYDSYIKAGYKAMDESNFYDSIYSPIIICTSSMLIAIMMVCSSMGTGMQQLFGVTIGGAVAIIAYVGKVFDPLESLGMEIQNIQSALAGITRIDEFLEEEIQKPQQNQMKEECQKTSFNELTYDKNVDHYEGKDVISFQDVTFAYEEGKHIFTKETFSIKKGEHVIFTGRTGAGKSTLFKLLLGLYQPEQGQILVNGVPATAIAPPMRRRLFGYVEQHFSMIEGNIAQQITMYDERISKENVLEVLALCGLKEKIDNLPNGMETPMKSNDFSQGELQLLSIARALVSKPEIMLLDEMTANLDSVTEERILEIIKSASVGRTVLSISHRMAEKVADSRIISIG